jgi:peptidyl-prolyl cis-trans isomerase D
VQDRLMELEAHRLGVSVDDDAVARSLQSNPNLQRDGHFVGAAELRNLMAARGVSEEEFLEGTRDELLQRKLEALITAGVSVSPKEVEKEYRRRNEQAKVAYVLVDSGRFAGQVVVAEEDAHARFDSKKEAYKIPEKRVVSYILLDPQALQARVTVTPAEIQTYYNTHREEFRQEEQACASHILVKVKQTPEAKNGHPDAEAKRMAEDLLAQIKGGADFATLAKKSSEDEGSKQAGGDLGCFPRGRMVPEFEKAAFGLDAGQLSDVVKSNFGYHVIRLNSRKPESVQSLEESRARIRQTLMTEQAQTMAEARAQAVAGRLARGRSLEEAGKDEGVAVQQSPAFGRGETLEPLSSPPLVARAFELQKGEVAKEPFRVSRGYVFISVKDVVPPHLPDWTAAREKVKAELTEEKALEKAQEMALGLKTRAEKEGLEKAATGLGLVRKETPNLVGRGQAVGDLSSSAALDAVVFSIPLKTLSDPVRSGEGYAILQVLEKKPFDPAAFEAGRASFAASLESEKRSKLFEAYMANVRRRVSVEKMPEVYRRLTS